MYRIDNATAITPIPTPAAVGPNPNYFFTKGNPGLGVPATIVDDDWANAVQEEICAVIAAAGISLSKTVRTQLRDAVFALGAKIFDHTQGAPNVSWTVNHNMGTVNHNKPSVLVGGKFIEPDWDQSTIGANTDTLIFNEAVSGSCHVSL